MEAGTAQPAATDVRDPSTRTRTSTMRTRWLSTRGTVGAVGEGADFGEEGILGGGGEEAFGGVEAATFVTALLEDARGGEVAEDVVAIGRKPEVERADGLFDERDVVSDNFAGEANQGEVGAELPEGDGRFVGRLQFFA